MNSSKMHKHQILPLFTGNIFLMCLIVGKYEENKYFLMQITYAISCYKVFLKPAFIYKSIEKLHFSVAFHYSISQSSCIDIFILIKNCSLPVLESISQSFSYFPLFSLIYLFLCILSRYHCRLYLNFTEFNYPFY